MKANYTESFQRDFMPDGNGGGIYTSAPYVTRWSFSFAPVIGFGYWKDDYSNVLTKGSYAINFILPFMRLQFSLIYLLNNGQEAQESDTTKMPKDQNLD